jgi:HlyD family secretion protein
MRRTTGCIMTSILRSGAEEAKLRARIRCRVYLRRVDLQSLQIDRRSAAAARRRRASPWPLRLLALLALLLLGWLFLPALSGVVDRVRLPAVKTMVLSAPPPAAAAAATGTAANGYVVAARRAALSSDVPGRIVEMLVKEGSVVKRGDVVARLFSDEFAAALARAEADLAVAAAGAARAKRSQEAAVAEEKQSKEAVETAKELLAEAQAQCHWAEAEFQRVEDLVRQQIASPRDLDKAKSDLDAARAKARSLDSGQRAATAASATAAVRVQVAEADQVLAEAQQQAAAASMRQAQAALDKTDVRAPFDGIVVLKDAEVGEVVSPNVQGGGTARGAVCTMVDFDSLEIQANVPESSLAAVHVGAACAVFLDADPDRKLPGRVDRIWPTADRQKATVEVRIVLLQRSEMLRPEMGVRVVFLQDAPSGDPSGDPSGATGAAPRTGLLLVPDTALVEAGGRVSAFVLERDTVRLQELRVTERKNGRAAVESGLRAGQRIVLEPPTTLRDGDRVRLADG